MNEKAAIDESPIGRSGRVTHRVAAGILGQVSIPIRGGSECFSARPFNENEAFNIGEKIVVEDFAPPTTVYVSRYVAPKEK